MRIEAFYNDAGLLPIGEIRSNGIKHRLSARQQLRLDVPGFGLAWVTFSNF